MTILENGTFTHFARFEVTPNGIIAALWTAGLDTKEIASATGTDESAVANRLAAMRDAGR